jgi:hypothetical protein
MEEQDRSGKSDYSGNSPSTDNPLADPIPDPTPSPFRSSGEPEGKVTFRTEPSGQASGVTPPKTKIGLSSGESHFRTKRLSEAFWEGVASAKPGYEKQPPIGDTPPAPKDRQPSAQTGSLDWVIQAGKSAAEVVGHSASSLADSVANLAKKTPSIPTKWGEAFREGAASVRPQVVKPKAEPIPHSAVRQASVDKKIGDWVSRVSGSAGEVVRGALATFKPGEAGEIEKQIRLGEKKIRDLYVEIGREAADSWSSGGMVETEKVRSLLDEFREQEDVIRKLKAYSSEIATAKKAEANGIPPIAPEALSQPEGIQEELRREAEVIAAPSIREVLLPEADLSTPTPDEPVMILSATSGAEPLTGPITPEYTVDTGPAAQEEAGVGADPNLSAEPEGGQEK